MIKVSGQCSCLAKLILPRYYGKAYNQNASPLFRYLSKTKNPNASYCLETGKVLETFR